MRHTFSDSVFKLYNSYRDKGWSSALALRSARIEDTFSTLAELELVRLIWEPDIDTYDDSYIDTWDDASESEKSRYRRELWETIERDGVWFLVGQYKLPGGEWETADSIGGLVGQDGHGYTPDIMAETIDALRAELKSRCRCCRKPGSGRIRAFLASASGE